MPTIRPRSDTCAGLVWCSLPMVTMSGPVQRALDLLASAGSCSSYMPSPLAHRREHGVEDAVHDLVGSVCSSRQCLPSDSTGFSTSQRC